MTDAEFNAWLTDEQAIRMALVEVVVTSGGSTVTRYLSSGVYVTRAADTPANTAYLPVMMGGIKFTEHISTAGTAGMSYGDIELQNAEGDLDDWLYDIWKNRSIKVYLGDPRWVRSDFKLVFSGVVSDIDSKRQDRLNIKIIDNLQRLNTPVSENKLAGTTANKDRILPLLFGECHNIDPLLVDPATHKYQIHDGPVESIIEVRDNGVPVAFTPTLSAGTFVLTSQPVGTITVSAQGAKPSTYSNTVSQIVKMLVMSYGKVSDRFLIGELDTVNFDEFDAANPQPVGIYLKDRTNVLQVCQQLTSSVGSQLVSSPEGLLKILKLTLNRTDVRVNLCPYPTSVNSWVKNRTTVAQDTVLAPDGTLTADRVTTDATDNATHSTYFVSVPSYVIGDVATFVAEVSQVDTDEVYLQFSSGSLAFTASLGANFNFKTKTFSLVSAGITAFAEPIDGGFWRLYLQAAATGNGLVRSVVYFASSTFGSSTGRATLSLTGHTYNLDIAKGTLLKGAFDLPVAISGVDMYRQTISQSSRSEVQASVMVGYAKNWAVQQDLQVGLPEDHKTMFATEWWTKTASDAQVATDYKLDAAPIQRDTMLLVEADALAEAQRDLSLKKVQRMTYKFEGVPSTLALRVGQGVLLTHPRFGLSSGKIGVVVSRQPDWLNARTTLEVLV